LIFTLFVSSSVMNQSNLLEQAQQGEPSAIAALMNAALAPKGVTARVDLEGDCLYVMFESTQSLNPETLMRFTHRGLQELNKGLVKTVKLYEQRIGENTISWKREFMVGVPLAFPIEAARSGAIDEAHQGEPTVQPFTETLPLPLDDLIDQVELDQVDGPPHPGAAAPSFETFETSDEGLSTEGLSTPDARSPVTAFWRKHPIPFALMVSLAFMGGGVAALLMAQKQPQLAPNQGKQQEAETYLREMNEAQRAFYSQNNRFAASLEELERSANMFSKVYYYTYKLEAIDKGQAKITAVPKEPGLRSYVGAVFANTTPVTAVICQTQQPVELALPLPKLANNQPQCPAGTTALP
jgi:hypothetical protein